MNLYAPSMLVLEGVQISGWYNLAPEPHACHRVLEGVQISGWYNGFLAKRHSTCWNAVLLLRENKPRIHRNVSSIRNIEDFNPWFAPRFAPLSQSSHLCRSRHAPADTMRSTTRARFCVSSKSARFQVDTMPKAMVRAAHKSSKSTGPQVDEHEVVLNPAAIALGVG